MFAKWKRDGVDYALNLSTHELHRVRWGNIEGSHNLLTADLSNFLPIYDPNFFIAGLRNGDLFGLYDTSDQFLGVVKLDRCAHCFPASYTAFARLGAYFPN